jgi:hypothetical protein
MTSRKDKDPLPVEQAEVADDEGFLERWSRRKTEAMQPTAEPVQPVGPESTGPDDDEAVVETVLTDEDMPPLEELGEDSDYSGFLSSGVSETLRKQALKRLFHSAKFNVCDGLDDYAEDYTKFEPLGDIITADMKFEMEQAAKRALEAEAEADVEKEQGRVALSDETVSDEERDSSGHPEDEEQEDAESGEPDGLKDEDDARLG